MGRRRCLRLALDLFLAPVVSLLLIAGPVHGSGKRCYPAKVDKTGNRLGFQKIPIELLRSDVRMILEVVFQHGIQDLRAARFAVNGIEGRVPEISDTAVGEKGAVRFDVGRLTFDDGISFADRARAVVESGGQLTLWVTAPPSMVKRATLCLSPAPATRPPPPPDAFVTSVNPAARATIQRNFVFTFGGDPWAVAFECRVNGRSFERCQSPAVTSGLGRGWHTFRVRALDARGRHGKEGRYDFFIWGRDPQIAITRVTPAEPATSSRTLTLCFAAADGGKPFATECRLDDGPFTSCRSPIGYAGLADGTHVIEIRRRSGGKLWQRQYPPAAYSWQIDSRAPSVTWTSVPHTLTAAREIPFRFEADEPARFTCALDGESPIACESPHVVVDLPEGEHSLETRAVDAAGNRSEIIGFRWTIDRTVPVVTLEGVSPAQSPTAVDTLSLSFAASEPAVLECRLDGELVSPCASPLQLSGLSEGRHEIEITATDTAGNTGEPLVHSWEIDRGTLEVSILMLSPRWLPTQSVTATFRLSTEGAAGFYCSLDGEPWRDCDADLTVEGLAEGSHVLRAAAVDGMGQPGPAASVEWYVDRTMPILSLVGLSPDTSVTKETSLSLSFEADELATFTCEVDDGGAAPCASPFIVNGLALGEHRASLRAVDAAGNVSEPLSYRWTVAEEAIDETAPRVTLVAVTPAWSPTSQRSLQIDFAVDEPAQALCTLDGVTASCLTPFIASGLSDGTHTVSISARDGAGNDATPLTHTWEVDTVPLAILELSVTQITRSSAVIAWTTRVPATSLVAYGEGSLSRSSPASEGMVTNHQVVLSDLQRDTFYVFQARSTDRDGRSASSATVSFRTLQ